MKHIYLQRRGKTRLLVAGQIIPFRRYTVVAHFKLAVGCLFKGTFPLKISLLGGFDDYLLLIDVNYNVYHTKI